jgi:hypothetical protein
MTLQENNDLFSVICGESSPLASLCWLKLLAWEIYAIKAGAALTHPLKWSKFSVTFDHHD